MFWGAGIEIMTATPTTPCSTEALPPTETTGRPREAAARTHVCSQSMGSEAGRQLEVQAAGTGGEKRKVSFLA